MSFSLTFVLGLGAALVLSPSSRGPPLDGCGDESDDGGVGGGVGEDGVDGGEGVGGGVGSRRGFFSFFSFLSLLGVFSTLLLVVASCVLLDGISCR